MDTLFINENWIIETVFKMFTTYGPKLPLASPIHYNDSNEKEIINIFYNATEGLIETSYIDFLNLFSVIADELGFKVNSCKIIQEYNEKEKIDYYIFYYSIQIKKGKKLIFYEGYVTFQF